MRKYRRPLSNAANRERARAYRLVKCEGIDRIGSAHRQGGRCFLCQQPWGDHPMVLYLRPLKKGGTGEISNLRVICTGCRLDSARSRSAPSGKRRMKTPAEMVEAVYGRRRRTARSKIIEKSGKRDAIFNRAEGRCEWCGVVLSEDWHLDHLVPMSKGGTDEIENLRASCSSCNLSRGCMSADQFAVRICYDLV